MEPDARPPRWVLTRTRTDVAGRRRTTRTGGAGLITRYGVAHSSGGGGRDSGRLSRMLETLEAGLSQAKAGVDEDLLGELVDLVDHRGSTLRPRRRRQHPQGEGVPWFQRPNSRISA